ncbi:thiamine-phosphate kinase [Lysobacteraceae bacterium NML07-0707]|nr:thiamine-phosphate kinase [Xanthomonadaceae bacterium NML07-0707]
MAEFDLIERIRRRSQTRPDVVLGIGDDAALIAPPAGMQLVVATDTLNHGVHFPPQTHSFDIGWKALAVNLSDLAAMGAQPAWGSLSLSLPEADPDWLDGFIDGFMQLAGEHGLSLIGGDTTRGPLSVCVSVIGLIAPDQALRRDAAQPGDDVWVSGTLGDAAAALALWQQGHHIPQALRTRLDSPTPRLPLGQTLAGLAHAAVDISDGLLADVGHIAEASAVAIDIELEQLPASAALQALGVEPQTRRHWQASGGDDYELCFTAAPALRETIRSRALACGTAVTRIGRVCAGQGITAMLSGEPVQTIRNGFEHFAAR